MQKRKLDLKEVSVESFETDTESREKRGTIFAHAFTVIQQYCAETRYRHCPPTEYNDCTFAYPDEC